MTGALLGVVQQEPTADEFRFGHDVADEEREFLDVLRLRRSTESRADGIDEDEIALGQPRIGVVDELAPSPRSGPATSK